MTIKLIAIDMDETFLRTDKSYDRQRFARVFKELRDQGVIVLIASGNSYHQLKEQFTPDITQQLYFAGDNGSFIVKEDQVLDSQGLERELYLEIIDYIYAHSEANVHVCTGFESYIRKDDPSIEDAKIYNYVLYEVDQYQDIPEDKIAYKLAIHNDIPLEDNKALAEELNQAFPQTISVTSGNIYIDILNENSGKGHAVRFMQDRYQIQPEESVAFGDSLNDLSMMPEVNYNIAMANADPDLTAHCHYQIPSNDQDAVLDVLEAIADGNLDHYLKDYQLN
ncbi:HAD family hydrolase [Hutsoniella sourekii]|uniref:HAD family hydrolase n=1 Tax=Hutsoniella sourekii TaxID=87650 RepID=UPI000483102E|nr:HAD family hydrolase [Hutsoniella sourekii]